MKRMHVFVVAMWAVVGSVCMPLVTRAQNAPEITLEIRADIDGRSQLMLHGNTAQWHHFDFAAPGRERFTNFPTTINGVDWFPIWPDVPDAENRFCNCFSDVFPGVVPALPPQPMVIDLQILSVVRPDAPGEPAGTVAIVQFPTPENNFTIIVEFDDNAPPGSAFYDVRLRIRTLPMPVEPVCSLTQLTHSTTGDSDSPAINAAGTRIAFTSDADLTGGNADGRFEIFLVDTTTGSLTQLTTSTAPSFVSAINAAGTRIAFNSNADLTGGNADGSGEIFLVDTTTGSFSQLTHAPSGDSSTPAINAAGARIAFVSNTDLTGGNADGNPELFLVDTTTGSLTQLTHSTGPGISFFPAINAAGTRIAFSSTADLTGGNPDGNQEIFLIDTTTGSLTQLTHSTTGNSSSPAINAAGTRIAFQSEADLPGRNGGGNQIFLVDTTTGSLTQLTTSTTGGSGSPAINAAGTRIAFVSNADLTGGNPDGNQEIFLATCVEIVNDLVTFTPLPSTFTTTAESAGCPAGFAGTFRFTALLTVKPDSPSLADLRVQVQTLTNGNLLQNADSGPGGVGATLTVPQADAFADGILSPDESVDVPFVVCLQQLSPFRFFVDVLGESQ